MSMYKRGGGGEIKYRLEGVQHTVWLIDCLKSSADEEEHGSREELSLDRLAADSSLTKNEKFRVGR